MEEGDDGGDEEGEGAKMIRRIFAGEGGGGVDAGYSHADPFLPTFFDPEDVKIKLDPDDPNPDSAQ